MIKFFKTSTIAIISFIAFFVLCDLAWTGSDVLISYSTNECVEVINLDGVFFSAGDYDCENLPPRYNHVWVK